jgi:hypothetical protein
MARNRKTESETPPAATAMGHNGGIPDDEVVRDHVHRVENLIDELASEKGRYMQAARSIRDGIKRVIVEAKDAGIPRREFKAVIKARSLEHRLAEVRDELEPDEVQTFDQIRHALGDLADLPLGRAALDKAPDRPAA